MRRGNVREVDGKVAEKGVQVIVRRHREAGSLDLGEGVTVRTDKGTYQAGRLVLSAGPWMADLVPRAPSSFL